MPERTSTNRQIELMKRARQAASFNPRLLTSMIYDSEDAVKSTEIVLARVEAELDESDPKILPRAHGGLNRTTLYHDGLRSGKALIEDEIRHRHGLFDRATHQHTLINASPLGLHPAMFIPTLKLQASQEQLKYWLPLAESGKILGTYCQTELGHGTFVRGLETTATFDPSSDGFVIHSPTVTSTKYWPGGLGYSSSHAIVMARLILGAKDHGVHAFLIQLRSLDDFRPMPGIELGDIGMTMGLNGTDNGYAIFDRVRIPRSNMLMGSARVLEDGTYLGSPNNKHSYITMVYARNAIILKVPFQLAKAATIGIRYSVVREQGNLHFDPAITSETSIMTFKSQQYRLLVIMARAYALAFTSKPYKIIYHNIVSHKDGKDDGTLAYGHIITAGLKAYATQTASDGAEDARKCCGGHGYSCLSGLPGLVADVTSTATLEGENFVMYQQTARYLVKCATATRKGFPVHPPLAYLTGFRASARCPAHGLEFLNPKTQLSIFRHRSARQVLECEMLIEESITKEMMSQNEAWNAHMMSLIAAARAHIECFVLEAFIDQVSNINDVPLRNVLKDLCDLYVLSTIESPFSICSSGFLEDSYISGDQLREIRSLVNKLLLKLLPEAIGLADAWNFTDASLQSAIGQKDGNVYETLLSWTKQLPFNKACNQTDNVDQMGFERYIKPILRSRL